MSQPRATFGRLSPYDISYALRNGILTADAQKQCKIVSAENTRLQKENKTLRGTICDYRGRTLKSIQERDANRLTPGEAFVAGMIVTTAAMIVLWWLVDRWLLFGSTGSHGDWITSVRTAGAWAVGAYIVGALQGFIGGRKHGEMVRFKKRRK